MAAEPWRLNDHTRHCRLTIVTDEKFVSPFSFPNNPKFGPGLADSLVSGGCSMKHSLVLILVVMGLAIGVKRQAIAQSNYEVESESLANDSEASIEAEEEKIRSREAKRVSEREAIRAKKVIEEAKAKQAEFEAKESAFLAERKQAEARTQVAQDKIKVTTDELDARKAKLDEVQKETEHVISERDRSEALVEKVQDQIAKLNIELKNKIETRDRIRKELDQSKIRLDDGRKKYVELRTNDDSERANLQKEIASNRAELVKLNREWARMQKKLSVPPAANRGVASTKKSGSVRLTRDCSGFAEPMESARSLGDYKVGTKFSAEKFNDEWLKVHSAKGDAFMQKRCFKK